MRKKTSENVGGVCLIYNQKMMFKITLTLADISHCVVFALTSQTNLVNHLDIFTT